MAEAALKGEYPSDTMNGTTSNATVISVPAAPPLPVAKVKVGKGLGGPLFIIALVLIGCLLFSKRSRR